MRPDYKNLNWFYTAIVCVISVALFLGALIFFNSHATTQQNDFAGALNIFDINEQVAQEIDAVRFVAVEAPQSYLDKFYSAFVQVVSIPQENVPDFAVIPQGIRLAYQMALDHPIPRGEQRFRVSTGCTSTASAYKFSIPQINLIKLTKVDVSLVY